MPTYTTPGSPLTMTALAAWLDAAFGAAVTLNRGPTPPLNPFEGMLWWDSSGAPIDVLRRYTVAAGWIPLLSVNIATGAIVQIYGILDEDDMASDSAVLPPSQQSVKAYVDNAGLVSNLKPAVNAAVNKLDVFTKSGGAAPDATNIIKVAIPDGNGHTLRTRAAAYLSGTSQIVMANAANYWSKGSLDAEIKTAWLYAIWDGTGIVWALAGYSGFNRVPTTTTATDDDYFLLEDGSTYTRDNAHYCVAVAKIRYEYDTADTPDHTIQATVEDAPQVIWNPKSDYGYSKVLGSDYTRGIDIPVYSAVSLVARQSGKYFITGTVGGYSDGAPAQIDGEIKTGSGTYGSATPRSRAQNTSPFGSVLATANLSVIVYVNVGDTIHLGAGVISASGNRVVYADMTRLNFQRVD